MWDGCQKLLSFTMKLITVLVIQVSIMICIHIGCYTTFALCVGTFSSTSTFLPYFNYKWQNLFLRSALRCTILAFACGKGRGSICSNYKYRLDNEAEGSTRNSNPRSHTIEPKREARGFYMASRVSMERRSRWPSCLTDLEYSNRCYAADVFRLQAFACLTLACFAEQSEERQ